MTTIDDHSPRFTARTSESGERETIRDLPDGFDQPGSPWHVPADLRDDYRRVELDREAAKYVQALAEGRKQRDEWAREIKQRRHALRPEKFAEWRAKAMDSAGNPTKQGLSRMLEHSYGPAIPTDVERAVGEHRRLLVLARVEVEARRQRAESQQLRVERETCELCGDRQVPSGRERRRDPLMRTIPGTDREARLCDACWPVVDVEARRAQPLSDGRTRAQAAREWLGVSGRTGDAPALKRRGRRR